MKLADAVQGGLLNVGMHSLPIFRTNVHYKKKLGFDNLWLCRES